MMKFWLSSLLLLIWPNYSSAQELDLSQAKIITHVSGENTHGSWSPDGQLIAFQTNRNGSWDIYCYSLPQDSVYPLIVSSANVQHPEWFPDGKRLVFDSDTLGIDYLFVYQLDNRLISPLFKREIECKEASFPPSPRQVYFTGFDKISQEWQIYNYDFVYDNLNQLTHSKVKCSGPHVAPDGKHVAFYKSASVLESSSVPVINWYGEEVLFLDSLQAVDPCWDPTGLKIYFVSHRDEETGELYSIWKNKTHLERLTSDSLEIKQPAVSPDGRYLVVSAINTSGSYLILIDLWTQ